MCKSSIILLAIISIKIINCDVKLKIFRVIDEIYAPVNLGVTEKVGNNLTLTCDLTSNSGLFDDQITWGKATSDFKFKNKTDLEILARNDTTKLFALAKQSGVNRAVKKFIPLTAEDAGTYFCGTLKFMVFEVIYLFIKDVTPKQSARQFYRTNFLTDVNNRENFYCNEKMFKCKANGACINQHYVCDNRPDCSDGSDESFETCNGDPCKGKLECEDGRCIPIEWCCDRHHDIACNVTYRPRCCPKFDTYEEAEYGYVPYNMTQFRSTGTRYILISLCILATFFSIILMVLILSKVFIFAKKTSACTRTGDHFQLEERVHPFRTNIPCNYRSRTVLGNVHYVQADTTDSTVVANDMAQETVDTLLILSDDILRYGGDVSDRPPSYSDVVSSHEPPPPYSSQDCLKHL